METEGSLPRSQKTDTCPHSKPHESDLNPNQFLEHRFQYDPPIYTEIFHVNYYRQLSPPIFCMHLSSPSYVLYAPPTSTFFFIWSPE